MIPAERTDGVDNFIHIPERHTVHKAVSLIEIFFDCTIVQFVALGVGLVEKSENRFTIVKVGIIGTHVFFQVFGVILLSSCINQLLSNDFFRPGDDAVHALGPAHWISGFQFFRNALCGF